MKLDQRNGDTDVEDLLRVRVCLYAAYTPRAVPKNFLRMVYCLLLPTKLVCPAVHRRGRHFVGVYTMKLRQYGKT